MPWQWTPLRVLEEWRSRSFLRQHWPAALSDADSPACLGSPEFSRTGGMQPPHLETGETGGQGGRGADTVESSWNVVDNKGPSWVKFVIWFDFTN